MPESKDSGKEQGKQLFNTLFRCWSHNPVATFALCLLAEAYELSACPPLRLDRDGRSNGSECQANHGAAVQRL